MRARRIRVVFPDPDGPAPRLAASAGRIGPLSPDGPGRWRAAYELPDTEIIHLLTFGDAPYAHRELAQYFRTNSFFIAENVRGIIQEGLGDYTPIHLSDIPPPFSSPRGPRGHP